MQRFCFTLDLHDDPALIAQYEEHHRAVPEMILASIRASGIHAMEIYRAGTRLFMVVDADDVFTLERKAAMDAANPAVQAWEQAMEAFQHAPADGSPKWKRLDSLFTLP